jgi:hypothetical protein
MRHRTLLAGAAMVGLTTPGLSAQAANSQQAVDSACV